MVTGPRQSGKTTLVRELIKGERRYVTLDDDTPLEAALSDPVGFIRGLDQAIIDEIQRAPELLRAIKMSVDKDRRPGRFLLTGSANVLALPQVSESLAGRMEIVDLLPLSPAEIRGDRPQFLQQAFEGRPTEPRHSLIGDDLVHTVLTGGYPEMIRRRDEKRRQSWARNYLSTLVRRDVSDIADVEKQQGMARMFRILAHHSAKLTNFSQVGGQVGLDDKTARRYVLILEQLFIVRRLEPWFRNRIKRLVKTPKLHFLDSGLLAASLGATLERVEKDRSIFGRLLETFVFSEVLRQSGWFPETCDLYHFRDKDQNEVDIVAEDLVGGVVGIEVKASATVRAGDFKGLRKLADAAGKDFRIGLVLYDGDRVFSFGDRLFAAPVSCLWMPGPEKV
jgi:predicted AAA+ superfamily ATPase